MRLVGTNILQKNWLIARLLEREIRQAVVRFMPSGPLLDAACGSKPYASFVAARTNLHIGLDRGSFLVGRNLDVYGSISSLPFKDGAFNSVLCTEAIQYVAEPGLVFREFHRILREQGVVILSTTQMWHVTNIPHDCYRYTEYGLRHLAEGHGFTVLYHRGIGGFWARIGLKFCYFVHRLAIVRWFRLPVSVLLVLPQLFFRGMDRLFFDPKDVINHIVVLKKK